MRRYVSNHATSKLVIWKFLAPLIGTDRTKEAVRVVEIYFNSF